MRLFCDDMIKNEDEENKRAERKKQKNQQYLAVLLLFGPVPLLFFIQMDIAFK